jgi:predicted glycoside hydrolase/deacetylase ChbG (UPF0249 family)
MATPALPSPHLRVSLIVTADDLGYCRERDDGILEASTAGGGAVRSVSLLVAGRPHQRHALAARSLRRAVAAGLDVGLHLNLTEGVPLCDWRTIPSLLAPLAAGASTDDKTPRVFRGKVGFRKAWDHGCIDAADVRREALAQFQWFEQHHPHRQVCDWRAWCWIFVAYLPDSCLPNCVS